MRRRNKCFQVLLVLNFSAKNVKVRGKSPCEFQKKMFQTEYYFLKEKNCIVFFFILNDRNKEPVNKELLQTTKLFVLPYPNINYTVAEVCYITSI